VTDRDDGLLQAIARRNWVILATLILISLGWQSVNVTIGVAGGGLIAIVGHHWRHLALKKVLGQASGTARGFQIGYMVRLATLAGAIYLLIVPLQTPPAALAAGLSTVVINILITTVTKSF